MNTHVKKPMETSCRPQKHLRSLDQLISATQVLVFIKQVYTISLKIKKNQKINKNLYYVLLIYPR